MADSPYPRAVKTADDEAPRTVDWFPMVSTQLLTGYPRKEFRPITFLMIAKWLEIGKQSTT
tara:strand:+ start:184 stop:366 length:183 start_codon:yes stop_codon:yes gene_type:complete